MAEHNWFHPNMDREGAINAVVNQFRNTRRGCFLVRCSATVPGCPFTLTYCNDQGDVRHTRVMRTANGGLSLNGIEFNDIYDLIDRMRLDGELPFDPCEN